MSDTLSRERIRFLLSTTRKRGIYETTIQDHVDSGELAVNVSQLDYFVGKDSAAIRNSLNSNIESKTEENDWPELTVVLDRTDRKNPQVLLVNVDMLAEDEDEEVSEDEDDTEVAA